MDWMPKINIWNVKRQVVVAVIMIASVCMYKLLVNNYTLWTGHQQPHKNDPSQIKKLSNVDRCMNNFDFHIVDQSSNNSNKLHPIEFLPNLRNPCWFEYFNRQSVANLHKSPYITILEDRNDKDQFRMKKQLAMLIEEMEVRLKSDSWHRNIRMRCLPFFIIIGVAKCGTTDLHNRLGLHPQVEMGILKEPNWFTRSLLRRPKKPFDYALTTFDQYVDIYGLAAINIERQLSANYCNIQSNTRLSIIGDGSSATFSDPTWLVKSSIYGQKYHDELNTSKYLRWMIPQSKIIVLVREPVMRLLSDYLYFDNKSLVSAADFHHRAVQTTIMFNECREQHGERFCINDKETTRSYTLNIHRGLYSVYLKDWLTSFSRENILVLKTEDYAVNQILTLRKVYQFLNLDRLTNEQEDNIKMQEIHNKGSKSISEIWNNTKKLLKDFYQPYNIELAELLQDKRFLWT